jgi:hypothetical protein
VTSPTDNQPPSDRDAFDLTVVIACYMEEGHLADSIRQLTKTLDRLRLTYELVFVEDKSTDRTAEIVAELVRGHDNRRAVYHDRNVGRGGTVTEGFLLARGRVVGFLDIDRGAQGGRSVHRAGRVGEQGGSRERRATPVRREAAPCGGPPPRGPSFGRYPR